MVGKVYGSRLPSWRREVRNLVLSQLKSSAALDPHCATGDKGYT